MSDARQRSPLERLVTVGVELTLLALTWRALEGPDPRDLARAAAAFVLRPLEQRAAMLATLQEVRDLPETEARP
jgi:hypothetical protein